MKELMITAPDRKVEWLLEKEIIAPCDEKLISIVLQNLLSNAFKFSSKKHLAKIEFGSENKDNKTIYFIKDNGDGFDMSYSNKLFSAFQRLHHKTDFEGIGIGLATVQRIINRHNGTIWAEAKPGEGAIFYFTL